MLIFAVIGTNFITKDFMRSGLLCDEFRLGAVYSRTKQRAEEFASEYGVKKCYDSLEDLCGDTEIDAVYIASPTSLHSQQAIRMLKAGKHVLCEKPVASNLKELTAMCAAASESGRVLLEAMRPVFTPAFRAMGDNLHKLGKIRRVTFNFCQYSSRYDKFKNGIIENAFDPGFSNGALMDIGVYCAHTLCGLFGKPRNINASGILLSNGIDGAGTILAGYEGFQAELLYSKITTSYNPSEIQGEEGCMLIDKISEPRDVKIIYRSGQEEKLQIEQLADDMYYEIQEFIRLAQSGETAESYNQNSISTIELLDEARKIMGIRFPADDKVLL